MRTAVKLPPDLLAVVEAEATLRGLDPNVQLELWIRLGRLLENLAASVNQGPPGHASTGLAGDPIASLDRLCETDERPTVRRQLAQWIASGNSLYQADPTNPDGVVEIRQEERQRGGPGVDLEFPGFRFGASGT